MQTIKPYLRWIPNIVAAIILLQTLAFKFTAAPESVALFTELNLLGLGETIPRIGTGIVELIVGIMFFVRRSEKFAAIGALGLMAGALFFHATILGFEGENLTLTIMAIIVIAMSGITLGRKK
jgi:Ca2+/Na+ antiporter